VHSPPLHGLDQRAEVAVTGKQHHLVDMLGDFHRVDRDLDTHVAFDFATAFAIVKLFRGFRNDGVAVVTEPVDQGTYRQIFLIFKDRGVVKCVQQSSAALEFPEQAPEVNIETECLGGPIEVIAVDEDRDFAFRSYNPCSPDGASNDHLMGTDGSGGRT